LDKDFAAFLQTHFDGKSRQKLKNKINRLHRDYRIETLAGEEDDLELLFQYNHERFGGSSSFIWEYRKQIFYDLYSLYPSDVFVVQVDGVTKAVSFSLVYKKTYLSMNIGYDYSVRDLGKFVVYSQIQRAIELGCTVFDAGKGDSGWKEQFGLKKIPQYMIKVSPQITGQERIQA
jgi:CelD/BcsL family acetyltransferase involved in cellulose biosynthesis